MTGWTSTDVPDQTGRTVVVTGANSGLGLEASVVLAGAGARVLMTSRDPDRGAAALAELRTRVPEAAAELVPLDLNDLASVRAAAGQIGDRADRVDLLLNNAGVMATPFARTADGFEQQIGTNHLGPFALTGLLWDRLVQGRETRVVTVSSVAHRQGRIDLDDLSFTRRRYRPWAAYGQSKLANLLFTAELGRRATRAGSPVTAVAAHPGVSSTNLFAGPRIAHNRVGRALAGRVVRLIGQPPETAVWPLLYAATMPDVVDGEYLGPGGPGERTGYPVRVGRSAAALDQDVATRLWDLSEELTGVRYPSRPVAG